MLWAMNEDEPGVQVGYPYFSQDEPMVFDEPGTYVETDHVFTSTRTMEWNHGLGETVTALIGHGLRIDALTEHDSVPWEALPGRMTRDEQGEWRLSDHPERLAVSYTLQATRVSR